MIKKQQQAIINAYLSSPKRYIAGIDVGGRKMGLAFIDRYSPLGSPVVTEKSTILKRKNGKGYTKYTEGLIHEYVHAWVGERNTKYWKNTLLVGIEKQMTNNIYDETDRMCLMIEMALTCYFRTQVPRGGPFFIVVGPVGWKKAMGIEVGNHQQVASPSPSPSPPAWASKAGRFFPHVARTKRNPHYVDNKARANARFSELYNGRDGSIESQIVKAAVDADKTLLFDTDRKEALMLACAVYLNQEKYLIKACQADHHDYIEGKDKIRRSTLSKIKTPFKNIDEYDLDGDGVDDVMLDMEEDGIIEAYSDSSEEEGGAPPPPPLPLAASSSSKKKRKVKKTEKASI